MHFLLALCAVGAIIIARQLVFLYKSIKSPLRRVPGPLWAKVTRGWYFCRVWKGHFEKDNIELHQRHGPIVRIAPNWYSVTGTDAIKKIYGPGTKFAKSNWYDTWKHPDPDQWMLFSDKDIKRHAEMRKVFSALYSLTTLLSYESFVDQCVHIFVTRLSESADRNVDIDLGYWLQCYAFDVIGCITYGERFGFLDKGEDLEGAIKAVGTVAGYSALAGIYSEWHPFLYRIMGVLSGSGAAGRNYVRREARAKIHNHKQLKVDQGNFHEGMEEKQESFMTKLIRSQRQNPDKISDYHLFVMAQSNVIAGFDTTAISLTFTLYYLIKYPRVLKKLRDELHSASRHGSLSKDITFRETQNLPYFQAVLKEALRMHSATGLPLWRVVPEGGFELNGTYFPQGSIVGVNSWVAHYDEEVFVNATEFWPERWIDSDERRLKSMNEMFIPFGLGSRICLGRHIAMLEMSKLIPILIKHFDFELNLSHEYDTENYWFVKPRSLRVRVLRKSQEQD